MLVKEMGHDVGFELFLLVDHESTAMWKPRDNFGMFFIVEDFHKLKKEKEKVSNANREGSRTTDKKACLRMSFQRLRRTVFVAQTYLS